jgi:hypothetical protein
VTTTTFLVHAEEATPLPPPPPAAAATSKLQPLEPDLDDLIDALIRRNVKLVLLCDPRRDEAGPTVSTSNDNDDTACETYRPPTK